VAHRSREEGKLLSASLSLGKIPISVESRLCQRTREASEAAAEMKKVNFSCEYNHYWVRVCQYDEAEKRTRLARDSRLCPSCGAEGRIESVEQYESESLPT
jgi:hypothetical protein